MIGQAIKKLRKKRKMSQADLCEDIDKTQTYVSMIENDKANPSLNTIKKIAKSLKVPVAILFWFTLGEDDIDEDKKDSYKILKPSIDSLILEMMKVKSDSQ